LNRDFFPLHGLQAEVDAEVDTVCCQERIDHEKAIAGVEFDGDGFERLLWFPLQGS
jgi:hypothetical protein